MEWVSIVSLIPLPALRQYSKVKVVFIIQPLQCSSVVIVSMCRFWMIDGDVGHANMSGRLINQTLRKPFADVCWCRCEVGFFFFLSLCLLQTQWVTLSSNLRFQMPVCRNGLRQTCTAYAKKNKHNNNKKKLDALLNYLAIHCARTGSIFNPSEEVRPALIWLCASNLVGERGFILSDHSEMPHNDSVRQTLVSSVTSGRICWLKQPVRAPWGLF